MVGLDSNKERTGMAVAGERKKLKDLIREKKHVVSPAPDFIIKLVPLIPTLDLLLTWKIFHLSSKHILGEMIDNERRGEEGIF